MKDKPVLIDTNILVYAYDVSEKVKNKKAEELLEKCWKGEVEFTISLQNLSEFYIVITKKINTPLDKNEAQKIVNQLIEFKKWIKICPKESTIKKAMELSAEQEIYYWDALITAVMLENDVKTIYTENIKDFSKIKELKAINPFSKV